MSDTTDSRKVKFDDSSPGSDSDKSSEDDSSGSDTSVPDSADSSPGTSTKLTPSSTPVMSTESTPASTPGTPAESLLLDPVSPNPSTAGVTTITAHKIDPTETTTTKPAIKAPDDPPTDDIVLIDAPATGPVAEKPTETAESIAVESPAPIAPPEPSTTALTPQPDAITEGTEIPVETQTSRMPGEFPADLLPTEKTEKTADPQTQSLVSTTGPSRSQGIFGSVSIRWKEIRGRYGRVFNLAKQFSDAKTTYGDWRRLKYEKRLTEAKKGLEDCTKERDELLSKMWSRQTGGREWTADDRIEIEADKASWKTCSDAFIRHRCAIAPAARNLRYWNDGIKIDKDSTHYIQNKIIPILRRKGDKRFSQAFEILSRGPLDQSDRDRAGDLEVQGRYCVNQEQENEKALEEQFKKDCLTARQTSASPSEAAPS